MNLWHRKFITADVTAVFSDEDKIVIKSLYLKGTQQDVDRRISPEKLDKALC